MKIMYSLLIPATATAKKWFSSIEPYWLSLENAPLGNSLKLYGNIGWVHLAVMKEREVSVSGYPRRAQCCTVTVTG